MPDFVQLWVYLSSAPLVGLTATLVVYLLAMAGYQRAGHAPWANPVLWSIVVIGAGLLASGVPYPSYFAGAQFIHFLLGPAVVALGLFWLPGALLDHAVTVVPQVKRQEIGAALLANIRRVAGRPCDEASALPALGRLSARLPSPDGPSRLIVLRGGVSDAAHLPGGILLLGRALFEDYEEPDVAAGYIVAEHLRTELEDPLHALLSHAGFFATVRLLTTGALTEAQLQAYTEQLLTEPPVPLDDETLLAGFEAWSVRSTPYAYARDITGETTLGLIEADPFAQNAPDALIPDADWLRLQGICGG